jgi:hypothetical protein
MTFGIQKKELNEFVRNYVTINKKFRKISGLYPFLVCMSSPIFRNFPETMSNNRNI